MADTKQAAKSTATSQEWKDAPEVNQLPTGGRGRAAKDNPMLARVQAALDGKRIDPKHEGYFLGRGVYASDERNFKLAARLFHQAAATLNASAMVRKGKADENGIPVSFSVNPVRNTRS